MLMTTMTMMAVVYPSIVDGPSPHTHVDQHLWRIPPLVSRGKCRDAAPRSDRSETRRRVVGYPAAHALSAPVRVHTRPAPPHGGGLFGGVPRATRRWRPRPRRAPRAGAAVRPQTPNSKLSGTERHTLGSGLDSEPKG